MTQLVETDKRDGRPSEIDRLETAVRHRLSGRLRNFRLLMLAEGLILYGEPHTFHAKQLAQHAIMDATELPIVANEIVVIS